MIDSPGRLREAGARVPFATAARFGTHSIVVFSIVLMVGAAHASGGDSASASSDAMWQAINLILILAILVFFARKPVIEFFADRRAQITSDLDSAAELLSQAETRNAELSRRLVDLDSQIEEVKETARRRADEESERILAAAERTAERIRSDAIAAIDQELTRAQRELRTEAADLALELAAGLLRDQVGDADRDRLIDEFITRIEPGADAASS